MTDKLIRKEDALAVMQRAVDGYGQKMQSATDKKEKRDWQPMLFAIEALVHIMQSIAALEPVAALAEALAVPTDVDREWIDTRADELFRENERCRGSIRPQTITPQDFRDYFVVNATLERFAALRAALDEAEARADRLDTDVDRLIVIRDETMAERDAAQNKVKILEEELAYLRKLSESYSEAEKAAIREDMAKMTAAAIAARAELRVSNE